MGQLAKVSVGKQEVSVDEQWLPVTGDETAAPRLLHVKDTADVDQFQLFVPEPTRMEWLVFRLALALERPTSFLVSQIRSEAERGAHFLWAPVFFGAGSVIYFNLPREPLSLAFPLLGLIALCATIAVAWRHWFGNLFAGLALVAAGATTAQMKTIATDTSMMSRLAIAQIQGQVVNAEIRATGAVRYTIDLLPGERGFDVNRWHTRPERVRLTARKGAELVPVGSLIGGRARLGPPPGPSFPGAYDFSFQAWFDGIGASGFFLEKPIKLGGSANTGTSWKLRITQIRSHIAGLIRQALPGRGGGLAAALIVGDRSGIDEQTAEALRRSGLAHILAISGLHMALVAMTVILTLRSVLAFFPKMTLYYPVRKWASAGALAAATVYLLLSGANVSTQRAYIMVAIMLVAVMCDRRALTMRNVAIAAFIVLLMAPQAILTPGFQMSFAAVAALVATYEVLTRRAERKDRSAPVDLLGLGLNYVRRNVGGLAMTSLVAGFATGIFAAYHFHRVAAFGLIANLLAMPLVSIAVMPLALVSVLAMPFGLETYPLQLMAWSMDGVVNIASYVARMGPAGNTGFVPVSTLMLATAALLIATLMRSKLKIAAFPFVFFAVLSLQTNSKPNILIHENGNQIVILEADNEIRLLKPNSDKFTTKMWRMAYAKPLAEDATPVPRGASGAGFDCDRYGCSTQTQHLRIVHLRSTANMQTDCRMADIIVVRFWLQNACSDIAKEKRPIIIDGRSLQRGGAHAITLDADNNIYVATSYSGQHRPWNRHRAN